MKVKISKTINKYLSPIFRWTKALNSKYIVFSLLLLIVVLFFSVKSVSDKKFAQNKDEDLKSSFLLIENGDTEGAIKILEQRLVRNRSDAETAEKLAEYYFRAKKYDQFIELYSKYDFQDSQIYTMMAFIARSNGEDEKVLEYYKKAIELSPRNSNYYVNLANYYQVSNRVSDAFDTLRIGLKYQPKSSVLNLQAANCALQLGDIVAAKDYAGRVLKFDVDNNRAKEIIGMK